MNITMQLGDVDNVNGPYGWSTIVCLTPAGSPKAKVGHQCLPSLCGWPGRPVDSKNPRNRGSQKN